MINAVDEHLWWFAVGIGVAAVSLYVMMLCWGRKER